VHLDAAVRGEVAMERRRLLKVAALAGVGAVVGCQPGRPQSVPPTTASATATAGATATVTVSTTPSAQAGVDYAALRTALKGTLLMPGASGYTSAALPYNAALGPRKPAAIVRVADASDVATCVRRAGGRGVVLAARSGGHSYEGWSTPDRGIVVDLSALGSVRVRSDGTAVVGAGTRLIDVYAGLAAAGRALPGGSCPTVGIAGLTLGGGIGVLCRAYGLTCDRLRAADVVTADGDMRTVDANRDADLFWALRGGGGGNAAIVTAFTFETVPAPTVSTFSLAFPASRSAALLTAWQAWMAAAPDTLWSLCGITSAATPTNRISGTWLGSEDALAGHLDELVSAVGATPTRRLTHRFDYLDAMKYFAGCSDSIAACHPTSVPGGTLGREAFHAASRMLEHPLTANSAGKVVDLVRGGPSVVLLFDALRGQVGHVAADGTAFAHRGAIASIQIYSGASDGRSAVARVQRDLAPLTGSGAYVNYLNADQTDWAQAYYGSNLSRLHEVAQHYDPNGVFSFAQSVLRAGAS
jgi:FAD/FMN-containing dehydrogenase